MELATGVAKETKMKNIYDMAGNMWEWTTETGHHKKNNVASSTTFTVLRGGGNRYNGKYSISYRSGGAAIDENVVVDSSFREVLYLK